MAYKIINFPALRGDAPFTEKGMVHPDAHLSLLKLYNGHPLQTLDTSGGSANFAVPPAKTNQNVEITFVKTSADANVPTLVPYPGTADLINAPGAWGASSYAMATAQGTKVKLKSDGVSNWYVTG